MLQQNRAENFEEKGEEERRNHEIRLSMKQYLRRSSSQVQLGNATIWPNHRMMIAAMKKKMMVLPGEFARYLDRTDWEIWRLGLMRYCTFYVMSISAQSAMTREIFQQMIFFGSICIES